VCIRSNSLFRTKNQILTQIKIESVLAVDIKFLVECILDRYTEELNKTVFKKEIGLWTLFTHRLYHVKKFLIFYSNANFSIFISYWTPVIFGATNKVILAIRLQKSHEFSN
jgi:hypothetical protein